MALIAYAAGLALLRANPFNLSFWVLAALAGGRCRWVRNQIQFVGTNMAYCFLHVFGQAFIGHKEHPLFKIAKV